MPVTVEQEKCDACMKCAEVCPNQALEKVVGDDGKEHIKCVDETCIDCYLCIAECPNTALAQP